MKILLFLLLFSSALFGQSSTPILTIGGNSLRFTFTGDVVLTVPATGTLVAQSGILGTPVSGTLTNCTFPTLNQSTTGSAATLTTTRGIYGNNFDGSAALTQIIASTYGGTGNGFTKFSGASASEKTYTLPNASAAILTDNAAVTVAQGGTGVATLALNGVLYGNAATSVLALAVNSTATNKFLTQSSSNAPAWAALVSGDIPNNGANTTGSAATLTTSRNINSVAFNGSADITVTAAAGTLTGTVLNSTVVTSSLTQLGASCAMTTPSITGLATGSGVASASTASTLVARDANANISTDNLLSGYTTTVTAAGTLTLDVSSNWAQYFTGTTTHTVKLPVANTLVLGQSFNIVNNSTGLVTVQSSGTQTVLILDANTSAIVTCTTISGTDQTSWTYDYLGEVVTSGKSLSVSNRLTLAGTDGTTMTFPGTSATIARTDAANTFTGVQTMTSPSFTTPVLGTPSSGNLTSCTWGSTSGLVTSNAGTFAFNTMASGGIHYSTSTTAANANSTDFTFSTSSGVLDRISDAGTNASVDLLTLTHNSSGVIAASFGTGLLFNGQSSSTADRNIADISAIWTTATDASRVGNLVFQVANNTALATKATLTPTTFNIPTGSTYQINATDVLSGTTLGAGITASSLNGIFIGTQVILNGTTTYTPTTGTKTVTLVLVGAGGGGGGVKGAASSSGAAGGGGSGGVCVKTFGSVSGTYTVAVGALGAGGSGVTPSNGTGGGNTTFANGGTTYTAFGGSGGVAMTSNTTLQIKAGGAGGVVSTNGDVNGGGAPGEFGVTVTAALCNSGSGGSSPYGGGGVGLNSASATGTAGAGFGAGGAGASCIANSNQTGGAGTNGVLIIYEYK